MRGVCTGGMLAGLEDLAITPDCFDLVVGVSAGAVGSAYYLAGDATAGVAVYWDHLPRLGFVSPAASSGVGR
jgi:predicted patatin/cPLA2 family phospholipase